MVEAGRSLWRTSSGGHPAQVAQNDVQTDFEYLRG